MAKDEQATVTVLIVDDEPLVRMGLCILLENEPDLEVVGEAGTGLQALELCHRLRPRVVILDVRMPHMDGLAALAALQASPELSDTRVIMLTSFDEDDNVLQALHSGASGFLVKDGDPQDLLNAIRAVNDGNSALAPSVASQVISQLVRRSGTPTHVPGASDLTHREREIIVHVAKGKTNAEIARELVISLGTVRTHVARTMYKLEVHDRAQLVALAYITGLAYFGSTGYHV